MELPVGPMLLTVGGERPALVPWRHSSPGTNFTWSLKLQLVAGSARCWVSLIIQVSEAFRLEWWNALTDSVTTLPKPRARTQIWFFFKKKQKTGLPIGTKRQAIQIQDYSQMHYSTKDMTNGTWPAYFMNGSLPSPLLLTHLLSLFLKSSLMDAE